jgi:hypothetical protein
MDIGLRIDLVTIIGVTLFVLLVAAIVVPTRSKRKNEG